MMDVVAVNADNFDSQKHGRPNGLFLPIRPYLVAVKLLCVAANFAMCAVRFD
jgi:hypothetical protein